jgi:hypothetical protein
MIRGSEGPALNHLNRVAPPLLADRNFPSYLNPSTLWLALRQLLAVTV